MATRRSYNEGLLQIARGLRAGQTEAERLLWSCLRSRQLNDAKFRRQHPLGRYVLDFYCHAAGLAVELDGAHHYRDEQAAYDLERTAWLEGQGFKVLRFTNNEVLLGLDRVLERIRAELPSPQPSPVGRGKKAG
jgi:very-short-patch-repair endonuclease